MIKYKLTVGIIMLSLVVLSCNLPTKAASIQLTPSSSVSSESDVNSIPSATDYASVRLTGGDLPAGFRELTEQELTDLGLSSSQFTAAFGGMLSEAQPLNFAAFTNTSGNFEVIVSSLIAPLTVLEVAAIDLFLKDPQQLTRDFATAAGVSDLIIDENALPIGNASSSAAFSVPNAPLDMTGSLTISRHDKALQVAMVFFPAGTQPALTSSEIAEIIERKFSNLK